MGKRNSRFNRATYWAMLTLIVAVYAILIQVSSRPPHIAELIFVLLAVPRLHDIGRTGWWVAVPIAAEFVLLFVAIGSNIPAEAAQETLGFFFLAMLGALGVLGAIPGNPGTNRFGDPPPPGIRFR